MTRLASIPFPGLIKLLFAIGGVIFLRGLFIDLMEVDSAQYAAMAKEMVGTGSYLEIYYRGVDYLDKPPLIFWTAALFFKVFGVHTWIFKLPTLLFTMVGVYSTYRIGNMLYNKETGVVASLILFSSQATFLMTNDVRTDGLLTGIVAFSVWQILDYLKTHRKVYLVWGFIGIGLGMLAKGPIGMMIPFLALGTYLLANRKWSDIFRWDWLLGILITAMVLAPMAWGLYSQFDQHPEKEILFYSDAGNQVKTGVSGLKFFFWTQSFGRLTGENVWKDNSGPFFFVNNYLWSFLPFAFLGIWALFRSLIQAGRKMLTGRYSAHWLSIGGFLLPFIALSFSHYKLPHYIWPTYPFISLLTAHLVFKLMDRPGRWRIRLADILQGLVILTSIGVAIFIQFRFFPYPHWGLILGWASLVVWSIFLFTRRKPFARWVLASVTISLSVNLLMNSHFYPNLLQYQSSSQVGHYLDEKVDKALPVYVFPGDGGFALDFYAPHYQMFEPGKFRNGTIDPSKFLLVVNKNRSIAVEGYSREVVKDFPKFHVSMLTLEFLIPDSRPRALESIQIIRFTKSTDVNGGIE